MGRMVGYREWTRDRDIVSDLIMHCWLMKETTQQKKPASYMELKVAPHYTN